MICSDLTNVLTRAVAQKTPLKLSAEVGGEQRTYLARPVKLVGEGGEDGIWVQLPDEKHRVLEELSQLRPMCSASCCVDHARYCFETAVLERDRHFWLNDQIMLDALLLQSPADFRHVQERSCERL